MNDARSTSMAIGGCINEFPGELTVVLKGTPFLLASGELAAVADTVEDGFAGRSQRRRVGLVGRRKRFKRPFEVGRPRDYGLHPADEHEDASLRDGPWASDTGWTCGGMVA